MFKKSDLREITRLGYVLVDDTKGRFVPGDWDQVNLYDAAKYGKRATDSPVGLISRNSKGSWTVSLTFRTYARGGYVARNGVRILNRPKSRPQSVIVSRGSVAESIAEAHQQREALEAESKEVWDTWRRSEKEHNEASLAAQRAASKHLT